MEFKEYQERTIKEVEQFFQLLAEEQAAGRGRYASTEAFRRHLHLLRQTPHAYSSRENGIGLDLPTVCIKVPTGGGKTLLATQALGSIYRTILKERNGTGLALWVVPSSQIYTDTLRRLKDENDMYHRMLRHAVHGVFNVWEKDEIARITPSQLRTTLNILVVQLASTNRELKDTLKFFRDSGGNIVSHFPPEDDYEGHRKLKEQFPNLEMLENDQASGRYLCKTSVGNLVRICQPPVIIDEAHKFRSHRAWDTVAGFNASALVELSATPKPYKREDGATESPNIVTKVGGQELLDAQMIKLPMNIATSGRRDWKDVLTQARDRRKSLEKSALEDQAASGRHIRPIVLVQVERTGAEQRGARVGGQKVIHAEDVKEYLVQRLDVPENAIAIKSSEKDELIEHTDLLAEGCPIEWIITKSALQEGWDCPFAYILVSLNNTGAAQAMTQLIGRVLRQPYQRRTGREELNESYVYCLHQTSGEIARQVKAALEQEGYAEFAASMVRESVDGSTGRNIRESYIKREFADLYGKPFEGKIYLPQFCVKMGRKYERLDYFRHLIAKVEVDRFDYGFIWPLADRLAEAKDRFYRMTLGDDAPTSQRESAVDLLENDEQVQAWLTASLRYDYLSHKQLRRIVRRACERLYETELQLKGKLGLVKFVVRDHIERFVQEQIDIQTEKAFGELFDAGHILFYLYCRECNFMMPESIRIERVGPLTPMHHDDSKPIASSLFDFVEAESQNAYERQVALVLDRDAQVLWWFRNRVGEGNFSIQGFQRNRIYPDFLVQKKYESAKTHTVIVIESKGEHLEGNPDTKYKRAVAAYFERAGKKITWQQLGESFKDHVFRFQVLDEAQPHGRDWKDELHDLLAVQPMA